MGDMTKFRKLDEPRKSIDVSSGGDNLTSSLQNASRNEAVFAMRICWGSNVTRLR